MADALVEVPVQRRVKGRRKEAPTTATKQQRPTGDGAASEAVLAECERPPCAQPPPGSKKPFKCK